MNYNKQKIDLAKMIAKKEIGHMDLIDMLIDAREQRDKYKHTIKKFKRANYSLATKIINAKRYLIKVNKNLILNWTRF